MDDITRRTEAARRARRRTVNPFRKRRSWSAYIGTASVRDQIDALSRLLEAVHTDHADAAYFARTAARHAVEALINLGIKPPALIESFKAQKKRRRIWDSGRARRKRAARDRAEIDAAIAQLAVRSLERWQVPAAA